MTTLREAAQQALEALEWLKQRGLFGDFHGVTDTLRAALAEPDRAQKMRDAGYTRRPTIREMAEPESCQYPDCVDNGPDGKCTRWLLAECSKSEDYKPQRPAEPQERNFCPRCGKRTNDIHTCTPPQDDHFCDTHCTWADHAPGCVRAEPVQEQPICDECGRKKADGWALYCVDCMEPVFAPPQRTPLTEEEIAAITDEHWPDFVAFTRAIEAAHGIKEPE